MNSELHLCDHLDCDHPDTTPCAIIAYRSDGYSALWLVETYGPLDGLRLAWHLWRDGHVELPPEWYCADHAKAHGYCWGCGYFWSGAERFDFDPGILCPNCRENLGDDEWQDDEWLGLWEDYPGELITGDLGFVG